MRADLSRAGEVIRLFEEAESGIGALDIVVASTADMLVKPLADCAEEDYERIFATNAKGLFLTLREAARRLNDGGRIIVLSTGGPPRCHRSTGSATRRTSPRSPSFSPARPAGG